MLTFMYGEARVITKCKKLCTSVFSISVLMSAMITTADASYLDLGGFQSSEFTYLGAEPGEVPGTPTAWDPEPNSARELLLDENGKAINPAAGGATWSIMAKGLTDATGGDTHVGVTSDITSLGLGFSLEAIEGIIDNALDTWALVSGFTNLGKVDDGNVGFGMFESLGGHLGDIRIGAIAFDGVSGTLAHAFQPGTESFAADGSTILGDMHIDDEENWGDGTDGTLSLASVILHELGHSLGLGHSTDPGAIMRLNYSGQLELGADDIAGIQSIYGAAVPLPGAAFLFLSGIGALGFFSRKQARV